MTDREKLIEILTSEFHWTYTPMAINSIADYLIANGVVIAVKCAECRHRDKNDRNWCNYFMSAISPKTGFCYKGERMENNDQVF